ncbi:hypothetical protein ACWDZ8_12650, partial [Streptomyces sp. NPDC003233]
MSRAALLVLADGRFPAGGHAHSGGAEAAVKAGRITSAAGLEDFCRGRLQPAPSPPAPWKPPPPALPPLPAPVASGGREKA